jgi:hypothetical protein
MRDEETIREEKKSAKQKAEDLDDSEPLNAIAAMVVYRTLNWVEGEGVESLDEELLKISEESEKDEN